MIIGGDDVEEVEDELFYSLEGLGEVVLSLNFRRVELEF